MCGIAGFLTPTNTNDDQTLGAIAARMAAALAHRGPDDRGVWTDAADGVAFGHTRLAVVDVSPHGHQPMHSPCGRYCVVYNGEIYNHAHLRQELERGGHRFRGHSDTEVLLAAIVEWGLPAAVERFVGMFAFAVWDRKERRLTLVRDRLGIKPLYYGWMGDTFLFGSELKAFRAHPAFVGEVDRDALALYLAHNYVPAPHSIYRGVFKLPPGAMLSVCPKRNAARPTPATYWSLKSVVEDRSVDFNPRDGAGGTEVCGSDNPVRRAVRRTGLSAPRRTASAGSTNDIAIIDELDELLRDAVRLRMIADVPLGAFLSGGIDSTTVVALMQAQSTRPVKTFSIGFEEAGYNEAEYAKAVAAHLGTEHVEQYVTPADARNVIPLLPTLYDEPFADSSQIPTFLVSQLARQHVTVSLSGDGGDELFGGYERYTTMRRLWRKIGWCPRSLRKPLSRALTTLLPVRGLGTLGRKGRTLAGFLSLPDRPEMYLRMNTHWRDAASIVIDGDSTATLLSDATTWPPGLGFLEEMMYADTLTYLPDDILVKVDRASMAVSLEARVPLLDHRVVEFAWQIPADMKVRGGQTKWPLRQVLDRYVPRQLVERPKVGFGVPIDGWLRGPLREWAEELLDERRLAREGFFHPAPIREKWHEHLAGTQNWHYHLWDVLMFQAWQAAL